MSKAVRHVVGASLGGVQRCIICGIIIADYRNGASDTPGPIPTWPEGEIYVQGKNPTVYSTTEPEEGYEKCNE